MTSDIDTKELFLHCFDEAVADNIKRSPSFELSDFTATGRATAAYGGKRNVGWWRDNGHEMVDAWVKWREESGWSIWEYAPDKPAIEMELLFTLPGDIAVKAYIDRLFVTPAGELVVVDLKTGRTPETGEQLGLYASGLELLGYPRPSWGYYWTPGKGHGQPVALDRFTPDFFSRLFQDAIAGINAGSFLPHAANGCHNWCGVADYCAVVGGSKAVGVDPLAQDLTLATTNRGK